MSRRYCLISPCRDEAAFARRTLESVLAQSELPALWVIVDDGSSDDTPAILAEYARRHAFIRVVRRNDRGDRKLGGGVIDAFYAGLDTVDLDEFDYLCKLDLDLELPPRYFALLMDRMEAAPRLGNCSGKPWFLRRGRLISERLGDENAAGASKLYRTRCFREIGGFVRELMWDGIDGHRCRQRGWIAVSWDDPELRFLHLRPMGSSHKSWWSGRARHGIGQYFMGTGPLYMLLSALYRMTRPPRILGGLAMLVGYLQSWLRRAPRYDAPGFRRFLRRYQWACLLLGKRRATLRLNRHRASAWDPA
jgi:glycosyltransferase involved in cell wall biosynthesis